MLSMQVGEDLPDPAMLVQVEILGLERVGELQEGVRVDQDAAENRLFCFERVEG